MSKRQTLDRLLSKLGIASRGISAELIRTGRVRINHKVIYDPETWVSWPTDSVSVDKKEIQQSLGRFFVLHKPCGYITTHRDEKQRKTIYDLLPKHLGFIHSVGRLDKATSGLLLLTNDSALSHFLTDPINRVPRTYLVTLWGEFTVEKIKAAKLGIIDNGEHLKCHAASIQKITKHESHLEVILTQGKNREVRRLFKALGHEVTRLCRIQYGPFKLAELPLGAWQELPIDDVRALVAQSNLNP